MEEIQKTKLEGIGDWLLLWVIALSYSILNFAILSFFTIQKILHENQVYNNNLKLGPAFAQLKPHLGILYYELVASTIFILLAIIVLTLTLKKKKIAKMLNIIFIWVVFLIYGIGSWVVLFKDAQAGPGSMLIAPVLVIVTIVALVMAVIWTFYFRKSERVKNTLVN